MLVLFLFQAVDTLEPDPLEELVLSMAETPNQFLVGLGLGLAGGFQGAAVYSYYYGRPANFGDYVKDFAYKAFNDKTQHAGEGDFAVWPGAYVVGAGLSFPVGLAVAAKDERVRSGLRKRLSLRGAGLYLMGFALGAAAGITGGWLLR